jgi:hypothetical protein
MNVSDILNLTKPRGDEEDRLYTAESAEHRFITRPEKNLKMASIFIIILGIVCVDITMTITFKREPQTIEVQLKTIAAHNRNVKAATEQALKQLDTLMKTTIPIINKTDTRIDCKDFTQATPAADLIIDELPKLKPFLGQVSGVFMTIPKLTLKNCSEGAGAQCGSKGIDFDGNPGSPWKFTAKPVVKDIPGQGNKYIAGFYQSH